MQISKEHLEAAFTEWERRFREEPESFYSEEEKLAEDPESYGAACTPYFIKILADVGVVVEQEEQ